MYAYMRVCARVIVKTAVLSQQGWVRQSADRLYSIRVEVGGRKMQQPPSSQNIESEKVMKEKNPNSNVTICQ